MHKALYRQFRPRTFDEISGQEGIVKVLSKQVQEQKPSHAYLFSGPRGTGKTSLAKIFANALNCLSPQGANPCLECAHCVDALKDASPDIIEIDGASNNGVDSAREIKDNVNLLPAGSKYKIYIIDEVHMLSTGAFNALLKTIEEPPAHVVFILATTEVRKLPATILSRCMRFDFKRIDTPTIVHRLRTVADDIGLQAQDDALLEIARLAEGGLRDALSILDKCSSVQNKLTLKDVNQILGLAPQDALMDIALAIADFNTAGAFISLKALEEQGVGADTVCSGLMDLFENLLTLSITGQDELAQKLGSHACVRAIDILAHAQNQMKYISRPGLALSAAIAKIMLPATDPEQVDVRIKAIEARLEKQANQPAVAMPAVAAPAPAPSAPPAKPQPKKVYADDKAQALLDKLISKCSPYIKPYLRSVFASGIQNGVLNLHAHRGKSVLANGLMSELAKTDEAEVKTELYELLKQEAENVRKIEVYIKEDVTEDLFDDANIEVID